MNFKTPFKVLTTAALIGTLSLSAVAPGAASAAEKTVTAQAETPANFAIEKVILVKGDSKISVSFDTYIDALGNETALNGYELAYVVAANGEVFALDTYVDFYEAGNTEEEVVEKLSKAGKTSEVTEVKDGAFNDGKLEPVEDTAATAKADLEKAVAAAKATEIKDAAAKAELTKAIEAAEKAAAKEDATKEELEAAKAELTKAVETAKKADAEAALEAKVESVKAINATTVEVKFTQALNKTDAETAGKVTIGSLSFAIRTLSEDGKTLTLRTTANAAIDVKDATVVVNPIQTKADANKKTDKYISLLTYKDEVAPTIKSVEAKTNGTVATSLTVKTSEPIASGLVKVNGSYATANFNNTDTATITGLSLETGKSHTIELINLKDMAGNNTVSTSANFTVSVDAAAPTATLTAESDKAILVTFNKPMKLSTVTAAFAANTPVKDEALGQVNTTAVTTAVADSNNTQFLIPITEANIYANKDSRTFNVVLPNTLEDSLGNKMETTTQKVTLTKDAVKPVATGYNVVKDADGKVTAIEVNFSEGLATGTPALPTIVDENGVAITATPGASAFLKGLTATAVTAGDKKVTYTATTPAKVAGKYAFSFKNELVSDLAETANKSAAFNFTMDFGKDESVTEFEIANSDINDSTTNEFVITFPEAVKGGAVANSATDLANYSLAGKPLPEGTAITFTDSSQKILKIKLPSESVAKDDEAAVFTVANIKNTAGTKTIKPFTGTVDVADNISPVLESAKAIDNKTIELTYSEALTNVGTDANVFNDFVITNGSTTALNLTTSQLKANSVSGFDKKVRITIDKEASASVPASVGSVTAGDGNTGSSVLTTGGTYTGNADSAYEVIVKTVDSSDKPATVTIKNASGVLADDVTVTPGSALNDTALKGITITLSDVVSAAGDKYTFNAVAAKGAIATVLDLTKDITVETKTSTIIKDKATSPNTQKTGVKVTVAKP